MIKGDVTSTKFKFIVTNPADGSDGGIASVVSEEITFLPPANSKSCDVPVEGSPFDKKEAWTSNCDYTCLSSCKEIQGNAPLCAKVNSCDG